MNKSIEKLVNQIKYKKSFLCVGLDPDVEKFPGFFKLYGDAIFEFCKCIIDATKDFAVAYKPNVAFFEAHGMNGWNSLNQIIDYIKEECPDVFTIADAKRCDIGNTAKKYASAFFESMNFDSITVSPYMGSDSVEPFLEFKDKITILLALTSNEGARDFQLSCDNNNLYEKVIKTSLTWKNSDRLMYVVGATKAEYFKRIRELAPESFLLVPGVGAQGGSLEDVCKYGLTKDVGLIVNMSRSILYASQGDDFAERAGEVAKNMQQQVERILKYKGFI